MSDQVIVMACKVPIPHDVLMYCSSVPWIFTPKRFCIICIHYISNWRHLMHAKCVFDNFYILYIILFIDSCLIGEKMRDETYSRNHLILNSNCLLWFPVILPVALILVSLVVSAAFWHNAMPFDSCICVCILFCKTTQTHCSNNTAVTCENKYLCCSRDILWGIEELLHYSL